MYMQMETDIKRKVENNKENVLPTSSLRRAFSWRRLCTSYDKGNSPRTAGPPQLGQLIFLMAD